MLRTFFRYLLETEPEEDLMTIDRDPRSGLITYLRFDKIFFFVYSVQFKSWLLLWRVKYFCVPDWELFKKWPHQLLPNSFFPSFFVYFPRWRLRWSDVRTLWPTPDTQLLIFCPRPFLPCNVYEVSVLSSDWRCCVVSYIQLCHSPQSCHQGSQDY